MRQLTAIKIAPKGRCGTALSTYVDSRSSTQVDDQLAGSLGATSVANLSGAQCALCPLWLT